MNASGHRFRLAVSAIASLVLTGCVTGAPASSAPGGSPGSPVASVSPAPSPTPVGSEPLAPCPNFVEVVQTGPMPGDDGTEDGPVAREQQRISADVDAATAYGREHPEEFASVRFENGPRVRLVIGFTAHLAEHCGALRELLEYPDEFEIIQQPATEAQLDAAMDAIVAQAGASLQSVGHGAGMLHVSLRADGEDVAAEIFSAHGELVEIVVGMLPYPNRFGGPPLCGPEPAPNASEAPLGLEVTLDPDAVTPGADFHGQVTITNTGPAPFDFQSGPTQTAAVYLPGANIPSGFFTGGMDAMGFGALLASGESVTLDVVGGTASCDPTLGYALPPGAYEVRVRVQVQTLHDNAPTDIAYLTSAPVPLTIAP